MNFRTLFFSWLAGLSVVFLGLNLYHFPTRFLLVLAIIGLPVSIGIVIGSKLEKRKIYQRIDLAFSELSDGTDIRNYDAMWKLYQRVRNEL